MISLSKTGKFIAQLRNDKKLSQEQLGNIIGIGRDSISKWERGVSLPSYEMLLGLSEEFDVSINEILYGERLTKENEGQINKVPVELYGNADKRKKIIWSLVIFIILVALFGVYYFINLYNSVKVYTVFGRGDTISVRSGIFVETKDKLYFGLNEFEISEGLEIENIKLYYKEMDNLIFSEDVTGFLIIDTYGAGEYFDVDKFKNLTEDMYLFVEYTNGESETIELEFTLDYRNSNLFFKRHHGNSTTDDDTDLDLIMKDQKYLTKGIMKKYELLDDGTYRYSIKKDGKNYYSYFNPKIGIIGLVVEQQNGAILEQWKFYTNGRLLEYYNSISEEANYSFVFNENNNNEFQCKVGKCINEQEKIEEFWDFFYDLL